MGNRSGLTRSGYLKILLLAIPVSVILNWGLASSLVNTVVYAVEPVIYGIAIALALNAPVQWIEALLRRYDRKKRISANTRTLIAVIVVMLFVAAIIYTIATSLIPQVRRMAESVIAYLSTNDLQEMIRKTFNISPEDWKNTVETWINNAVSSVGTYVWSGVSSVVSASSTVVRLLISLMLALYILFCRHSLHRQFRRVTRALLPEKTSGLINHTASLSVKTVSTWFGHQMLEGVIFGCVLAVLMLLFGMPYAVPISFFAAFLYMLPYVGGLAIIAFGFLIMLSVSIRLAVIFVVMVAVLQFLDGNILNPHLVGSSVGLPAWVSLAAICVFGALFGIPGMFLGVPAAAVIVALVKDLVVSREAAAAKEKAAEKAAADMAEEEEKNAAE